MCQRKEKKQVPLLLMNLLCCVAVDPYFHEDVQMLDEMSPLPVECISVCSWEESGMGCALSVYVAYIAIYLYIQLQFLTLSMCVSSAWVKLKLESE